MNTRTSPVRLDSFCGQSEIIHPAGPDLKRLAKDARQNANEVVVHCQCQYEHGTCKSKDNLEGGQEARKLRSPNRSESQMIVDNFERNPDFVRWTGQACSCAIDNWPRDPARFMILPWFCELGTTNAFTCVCSRKWSYLNRSLFLSAATKSRTWWLWTF